MLLSATMQIKRINWFSVLQSTNNVKYAGKFIQVSVHQELST